MLGAVGATNNRRGLFILSMQLLTGIANARIENLAWGFSTKDERSSEYAPSLKLPDMLALLLRGTVVHRAGRPVLPLTIRQPARFGYEPNRRIHDKHSVVQLRDVA